MTRFVSDYWMESKGFISNPKPIERNEWWWNLPLCDIELADSVILTEEATFGEAMEILQEEKIQQIPVTKQKNEILGIVTLSEIISSIISGKIEETDCVKKILMTEFHKVDLATPLSKIARIFEKANFAVVLDERKQECMGIVTQLDLLNFINTRYGHC